MIKRSIKQSLVAMTLVASIAFTCAPMVSHAKGVAYQGSELMFGIFMGYGPVAELLPEVHSDASTSDQEKALEQIDPEKVLAVLEAELASAKAAGAQEEVEVLEAIHARVQERGLTPDENQKPVSFEVLEDRINRHDATFFERFAKEIQSGDHLRIRKALREAHDVLMDLWLSQGVGMLGEMALASDSFIIQWTTVYLDTAVYGYSVIWEDKYIFGWFSANSTMEGALAEEMLVNAVAEKLALN